MKNKALNEALGAIIAYAPDYMHGLPKSYYIKTIMAALETHPAPPPRSGKYKLLTGEELLRELNHD